VKLLTYSDSDGNQSICLLDQCTEKIELVLPVKIVERCFGVQCDEERDVPKTSEDSRAEVF
jgi:hypothetical protein